MQSTLPSPTLSVTEADVDERTHVVALRGELDMATVSKLAAPLRDAVERGNLALVVDLCELTFLDSTGLMVLLNGLRRMTRVGGRLAIACANPTVLRLFDITGTRSTFTIEATREAAVAALAEPGPG